MTNRSVAILFAVSKLTSQNQQAANWQYHQLEHLLVIGAFIIIIIY